MADLLPQGVYFRPGQRPPPFFRLVTVNIDNGVTAAAARDAVAAAWAMFGELKQGRISDLSASEPNDPVIVENPAELEVTLLLGRRLFDPAAHVPAIAGPRPNDLPTLGPGPFPALPWGPTARPEAAQTDLAFMVNGGSELTVARAVVELEKVIQDQALPLHIVCFFSGLHRDDERSWIDFHDGLNNMRSGDERRLALEVTSERPWLIGGSKLLFLKVEIDLAGWRALSRAQQESLVGRKKLNGCPVVSVAVDAQGGLDVRGAAGCPANGGEIDRSNLDFITVPNPPTDRRVQVSHIHRSNRHRGPPSQDANNRIYRQGYEFIDSPPDGGVRAGLNFVSFQRHFGRVRDILQTPGWLGDANFGGEAGDPAVPDFPLMSIVAGGYFAVPPVADPFPGAVIFT